MAEPRTFVPLDEDGEPDKGRVHVQLMQHLPGQTQALVDWTGGTAVLVNGGPAVVLPNGDVVVLGDHALRYPRGRTRLEPADGLARRYTPAENEDT